MFNLFDFKQFTALVAYWKALFYDPQRRLCQIHNLWLLCKYILEWNWDFKNEECKWDLFFLPCNLNEFILHDTKFSFLCVSLLLEERLHAWCPLYRGIKNKLQQICQEAGILSYACASFHSYLQFLDSVWKGCSAMLDFRSNPAPTKSLWFGFCCIFLTACKQPQRLFLQTCTHEWIPLHE